MISLIGCETSKDYSLTYKLWNNGELRRYYEPATNPRLELFHDVKRTDVLALYDEVHETRSAVHRRAYYVNQNRQRIEARRKPRFVNPERAGGLPQVALVRAAQVVPTTIAPLEAIVSTNGQQFTLAADFGGHTHQLPVFQDRTGVAGCVLLSPLAVAGDVVMVGVVAGFYATWLYLSGNIFYGPQAAGDGLHRW